MRTKWLLGAVALAMAAMATWWVAARNGWLGHERDAGAITGTVIPAEVIAARTSAVAAAAPEG